MNEIRELIRKQSDDYSQPYLPIMFVDELEKDIQVYSNKKIIEQLRRLYPDCNGDISVSDDGGIASNLTLQDLIRELEK